MVLKQGPMKTSLGAKCKTEELEFPGFNGKKIEGNFQGGEVSSDGGLMLLKQVDRRLKLTEKLNQTLKDPRNPDMIKHRQIDMLRQRIYGLALGYEDLNDHDSLRKDLVWQTAVERDKPLASSPTLCRLEGRVEKQTAWAMHQIMVEQFISSFQKAPEELILDFDATDDRVHGNQEGRAFHGYYREWCFLPLYVFCGNQLLVSYLRPSNRGPARHAWAILKLLVKRLREAFPSVRLILRGDSGFCRWKMLRWCEKNGVFYIVGLAKNKRLLSLIEEPIKNVAEAFAATAEKQRHFGWISYAADSWDKKRQVVYKAEHMQKGANPRFILTNLEGDPQELYDKIYCARGEMENRIKEQQLGLFADRTSCKKWWANQFRLLLSSAAYILTEAIRRIGLKESKLSAAQVETIRLKLLKIGTVIVRNTRRIRLFFSSAYPYRQLFVSVLHRFNST
jgi:hypothetical protein